jgi:hypothetical protein
MEPNSITNNTSPNKPPDWVGIINIWRRLSTRGLDCIVVGRIEKSFRQPVVGLIVDNCAGFIGKFIKRIGKAKNYKDGRLFIIDFQKFISNVTTYQIFVWYQPKFIVIIYWTKKSPIANSERNRFCLNKTLILVWLKFTANVVGLASVSVGKKI